MMICGNTPNVKEMYRTEWMKKKIGLIITKKQKIEAVYQAYHTPSILDNCSFKSDNLILFGTAFKRTANDSFIIRTVVKITIIENTNVQMGSAIFAPGCCKRIKESHHGHHVNPNSIIQLTWIFITTAATNTPILCIKSPKTCITAAWILIFFFENSLICSSLLSHSGFPSSWLCRCLCWLKLRSAIPSKLFRWFIVSASFICNIAAGVPDGMLGFRASCGVFFVLNELVLLWLGDLYEQKLSLRLRLSRALGPFMFWAELLLRISSSSLDWYASSFNVEYLCLRIGFGLCECECEWECAWDSECEWPWQEPCSTNAILQ